MCIVGFGEFGKERVGNGSGDVVGDTNVGNFGNTRTVGNAGSKNDLGNQIRMGGEQL